MNIIKKSLIILVLLPYSNFCYGAECDWKTIVKITGGYLYTIDCHTQVGLDLKTIDNLHQIIEVKDNIIELYKQKSDLWKNTSDDLTKKITSISTMSNLEKICYFAAGFFMSSISVYLATKYK